MKTVRMSELSLDTVGQRIRVWIDDLCIEDVVKTVAVDQEAVYIAFEHAIPADAFKRYETAFGHSWRFHHTDYVEIADRQTVSASTDGGA